ncbi:hypothetical protein [Jiangella muralis]|uniref:bestrophin-like domain n=1 Tax=Jiangella muralis TaxID=702383 RepID=UPI00069EDBC8|nr:hypothetical protein [Jiangella muralis]
MSWLSSLPAGVLVVGCLVLALLVVVASTVAVRALVPEAGRDRVQQIAAPLMPALGAAFAILTALTLSSEAGYLRTAEGYVSDEGAAAARLAWAATNPGVDPEPVHAALRDYLTTTRDREWSGAAAASGDDPDTERAVAALERAVRTEAARWPDIGTPASTELLTSVDAVTSTRRARIVAADHQIPGLYVGTLVASGVALIVNASALAVRGGTRISLLVVGLAGVVGLSLALLFALSAPWRGPITVGGDAIDAVVSDLDTGFFTRG